MSVVPIPCCGAAAGCARSFDADLHSDDRLVVSAQSLPAGVTIPTAFLSARRLGPLPS
jgi:hypothetical protein